MNAAEIKPIPAGMGTVTPHLICAGAAEAIALSFEDLGGKTRYTALVRHWTVADRETHEKMGLHQGWGQCADQLAALVATL